MNDKRPNRPQKPNSGKRPDRAPARSFGSLNGKNAPSRPSYAEPPRGESRVREAMDRESVLALWHACPGEKAQESLSQLCALAKDNRVKALLNEQSDRAKLRGLLTHDAPKVRKNAARLLGALATESDASALIAALETEETAFVLPSLLLALGNAGGAEALCAVRKTMQALQTQDAQDKHVREAKEAATVALSRLTPREERAFRGFLEQKTIVLTALEGCGSLLLDEAKKAGLTPAAAEGDTLTFVTRDYPALFALRCFDEALLPLGKCALPPLDAKKADIELWAGKVARAAMPFGELLLSGLGGEPPFPYRIELRGVLHEERGPLAHAVARALDDGGLLRNAPSGYDAELRLVVSGTGTQIFAKLFVPADERFAYRLNSLPASISPVAAASLLRFALPFLKADARVLDPCCGSATLLIERAKLLGASELVGVDINAEAVRFARGNVKAAHASVEIIGGDLLTFRPRAPFDELIANLPFGTRVGTHDANAMLYKGLFERLPTLLAPDGVAILYTTQRGPLLRLAESNGYRVVAQQRMEAGGLNPWVIVLRG